MANLKQEIDQHCKEIGEKVVAFVVGDLVFDGRVLVRKSKRGRILGPEELSLLDREGNVHTVYVWTEKSVLLLVWDHREGPKLFSVPRDPIDCMPYCPP